MSILDDIRDDVVRGLGSEDIAVRYKINRERAWGFVKLWGDHARANRRSMPDVGHASEATRDGSVGGVPRRA